MSLLLLKSHGCKEGLLITLSSGLDIFSSKFIFTLKLSFRVMIDLFWAVDVALVILSVINWLWDLGQDSVLIYKMEIVISSSENFCQNR